MENGPKAGIYEFGEYRIDTLRMLLIRPTGEVVSLPPKAFAVLRLMIESRGRLLTKDELLNEAWKGTVVEEGNLTQAISVLRKALGERRTDHRYIVTVPGSGYRFVAGVREILNGNQIQQEPQQQQKEPLDPRARAKSSSSSADSSLATVPAVRRTDEISQTVHPLKWIVLIPALTLVMLGGYALYSRWTISPTHLPASVAEVTSLAVLPFENLGAEADHEYLGVGMADALITNLSNNRRIAVRPTNAVIKYSVQKPALTIVGRELQVDALLDGRMQRLGDRIRVTVQLVRARDGVPLWAEMFDERFTNVFALQDSIGRKVTEALLLRLSGGEQNVISMRFTENAGAYEAYLRGRFFWNKRTGEALQKSITFFEEAVRLDPQFALAYAGLAESYVILNMYGAEHRRDAFANARKAALKALSLNDTIAPAHTALALVKLEKDYDWTGAEESYRRALDLNPNYATAHHWYGEYLAFLGRFDESIKHIERAYQLDPASLVINTARGYPHMRAGECDTAITYFQKAIELDKTFPLAHFYMGKCHVEKARFAEAIREHLAAIGASGDSVMFMAALGYAYAASGRTKDARMVLNSMIETSRRRYVSPYSLATVYAGLEEKDEAFRWLVKAYEDRDYQLPTIKDDIHFVSLRGDPRFVMLLSQIGLRQ